MSAYRSEFGSASRAPSVPPGSTPGAQYYMAPSAPYNAGATPAQYMQTSAVGATAQYAHAPHHGYFGAPAAAHYPMSMTPYEHAPVAPLAPTMPLAPGPGYAPYNYGDSSITHHSRVVDSEQTAINSDTRLADQEHRRMSDLALRDNFERRLSELEAPIRDLKSVCEQRMAETQNLHTLIPRSTGAPRADLDQIRKTNISPIYKVRMVKELPISTQDKLNLIHEFRMAETMDDIIREREKDVKRSMVRHVY